MNSWYEEDHGFSYSVQYQKKLLNNIPSRYLDLKDINILDGHEMKDEEIRDAMLQDENIFKIQIL